MTCIHDHTVVAIIEHSPDIRRAWSLCANCREVLGCLTLSPIHPAIVPYESAPADINTDTCAAYGGTQCLSIE